MPLTPITEYRANPERAIFIQGRIDQSMVDRLAPKIISLQASSREPITIYIDSPGGTAASQEALLRLLSSGSQDYDPSCQLITVVTGTAASAAADLLCAGSYAIAYSGSRVFFHGVRTFSDDALTVSHVSKVMESLRLTNDRYAISLAEKSIWRFGFRYMFLWPGFDEFRQTIGNTDVGDLECFVGLVNPKLSSDAVKVVTRAAKRNARYEALVNKIIRSAGRRKGFTNPKRVAEQEALVIKGIVDFELASNKDTSWRFVDQGLGQLNADFLLVSEYINIYDSPHLKRLCDRFGDLYLSGEAKAELDGIADTQERENAKHEIQKTVLRPLWLFFVALCYSLQEGENNLTATDAYWLGLIDEVLGETDLFSVRLLAEAAKVLPTESETSE